MTTSTGRDCDDSHPGRSDSYRNHNSSMSGSTQHIPPSGAILPGGPNGPDGTIIEAVMTAVVGKKQPVRGQAYRAQNGEYVSYYCTDDEVLYRPGDSVYIESQKADQPYFICSIQEFRRSKRDNLMVNIKWFYRPSEVPETVYQLLIQDRNTENNNKTLAIDQPQVKSRELFISDATDTYPVSVLRGICKVEHYVDIHSVREFQQELNSFFYILGYNPETRRLASTQGEIRIGPSHQAKLPEFKGNIELDDRPEKCDDWEEIRWQPDRFDDENLIMYLQSVRSMTAFASLCNNDSLTDGTNAATKDSTTIGALDVLHETDYNRGKALDELTKCPIPEDLINKWLDEDIKRFVKGLRMYGKNFFRIRKEFLPHKETRELVSFYYLWKKTPAAAGHRPHRRHRRQNILRRIRNPRGNSRNTGPADPLDPSSASEKEDDSDDSDSKDRQGYHCRHCYTTASKDWHHAGKGKQLLCYNCRMHFKHYGDLPLITNPRDPPPPSASSKSQQQAVVEEEVGMRTRTRAKEISTRQRVSLRSGGNTPDINDDSDSLTPDRRTPDLIRPTTSSCSPLPKKFEVKMPKLKRMRLTEEEVLMEFANKKKKEEYTEPSGASSDNSLDSMSEDSSKYSQDAKSSAYAISNTSLENNSDISSRDIQSCSVILKVTPISKEEEIIPLSKSPDDTSNSSTSFLTADATSKLPNGSCEDANRSSDTDVSATFTEIKHNLNVKIEANSLPVTNYINDSLDRNKIELNKQLLSKMSSVVTVASYSPPIQSIAASLEDQVQVASATISTHTDASPISHTLNTLVSSHSHLPKDCEVVQHNTPLTSVCIRPHSCSTTSGSTTSVIQSAHLTEPGTIPTMLTGSRTSPLPDVSMNTLSVASMLSQSARISVLSPNEIGNRSSSPNYAPPPAHSSVAKHLPRAFPTASSPPVAHPSSHLFRPHPTAPLSHSALTLANSALNVSSMISPQVEAKSSRVQSPKSPLPLITGRPSSPLLEHHPNVPKASLQGNESNYYQSGINASQYNLAPGMMSSPSSYSTSTQLLHRPDKTNAPPSPFVGNPYSLKTDPDSMRHGGIGMQHFPFGKPSFHDSPLSLSTSGTDVLKGSRNSSPVPSGIGARVIHSTTPTGFIKSEFIKKEMDYSKDRLKQEGGGDFSRSEYKPELVKKERMDYNQERFDIKSDRYDRPEIISELKSESKPTTSSGLSSTGNIPPTMPPQVPGHYLYPYPYLPHQNQFVSPKFTRPSSPTTSSSQKSISPSLQHRLPAPPAHLGPPIFPGRPNIPSNSKTVGTQPSPGAPAKSPGSSICMLRQSPGLSLPTPPAAHTGPAKPPMTSHPLHSPLSCIPPNQQNLGSHSNHHHILPPLPSPSSHSGQPPTTQALPPTVPPSHSGFNSGSGLSAHDLDDHDEDDHPSPHREPSPAPKIEDSECHRSQSAIFLRHWNRGDFNSCSRTDLTFKPVPDSQLCRKREERARRQAEREREEKERAQKKIATPEKRETLKPLPPPVMAEIPTYSTTSMYDRLMPRSHDSPISTMSPISRLGSLPNPNMRPPGMGLPPSLGGASGAPHLDPILQHYGVAALYPPMGTRERMELERERDIDRLKEEMLKQRSHLEGPPPYAVGLSPHLLAAPRFGPQLQSPVHSSAFPPGLYAHPQSTTASLLAAERDRYERMAAASLVSYHASRPSLLRQSEAHQRLPHGYPSAAHAALLGRPYEEQIAHLAAQEQMQRQLLLERERLSQFNSGHFRP